MSQIGRKPINIPEGVSVTSDLNNISIKGKLGLLEYQFNSGITIDISDSLINVSRKSDEKEYRQLHGLTRALIYNMVIGVSEGYEKKMTLIGTGYTADASKGNFLLLNVGFSHPVYVQCPESITVKTPQPTEIIISGIDKHPSLKVHSSPSSSKITAFINIFLIALSSSPSSIKGVVSIKNNLIDLFI